MPLRLRAAAVAAALAFATTVQAQSPTELQGSVTGVVRLTGEVRVPADVTIEEDARLEIAKGTKIVFAARDARQTGFRTDLVEIHVKGELVVEGDLEAPVVFRGERELAPASGNEQTPQWHGIVFHAKKAKADRRDRISGAQFEAAVAALQVPAGDPLVEDCVFRGCSTAIEAGTAYKDDRLRGLTDGAGAPEVRRCRFADCRTGVYAAAFATPVVDRCAFYRCNLGVGPDRAGWTGPLEKPGASIANCAFVQCGTGVLGCSMTRRSVFANTVTVLQLSDFHDDFAVDVEQVVLEDCAVKDSSREVVGDTGAAREVLRHAFTFAGSYDTFAAAWPPLPDSLRVQTSGEGADAMAGLGPLAAAVAKDAASAFAGSDEWLRGWLAAPVDAGEWTKLQKPAPGGMALQSWWAVADTEPDGRLRARAAFGMLRTSGVLALEVHSEAGGDVKLLALGDLEALEASSNNKPATKVQKRRRFRGPAWQLPLKLEKGSNLVLVKATCWGADPQLALWIEGDATAVPAPAPPKTADLTAVARASKAKDGTYVEVTFSQSVHFRGTAGEPVTKVRTTASADEAIPVKEAWSGYKKLKIGPLPGGLSKGTLEVQFPGLRDTMGVAIQLAPVTVKLP